MVHLKHRLASTSVILAFVISMLSGCHADYFARKTMVEANPLSSGNYHIEIVGDNGLALLAYQTDVLDIDGHTQWNGLATIGAYGMAFQQECQSVWSTDVQAKRWRGKWVQSTATTPRLQVQNWLQEFSSGAGEYNTSAVLATSVLPLPETDSRTVVSVLLPNTQIDWSALCDAHIDTAFGSQAFLTDAQTGSATLYFDAATSDLIGVTFSASHGQTALKGIIILSTAYGHQLCEFPEANTISEGTLYEEWEIITP